MNFEQETNSSIWKKVHPTFRVHSVFHGGKQGSRVHKKKIYNQIRLVTIKNIACLEVKTQKPEITFLCDINNYTKLRQHIWSSHKEGNIYYILTKIKKNLNYTNLKFHRLIHTEWKITDHINRQGLDNREINLRETTHSQNALNCKLRKQNTSGFNGISYNKKCKSWTFNWYENNKHKVKYFKIKEESIKFKLEHDRITRNMNGKL
jgi:hypothetical protein